MTSGKTRNDMPKPNFNFAYHDHHKSVMNVRLRDTLLKVSFLPVFGFTEQCKQF